MGNFASKMGWRSKSHSEYTSRSRRSRNSAPLCPRGAVSDSDSHSGYLLPDLRRFSGQSSLSQAVFQAFRNSQMNPPHPITRKPTLLQRPRWSQWFGKQAEEDVRSSSFKSSFTARASALVDAERNEGVHGRFSLSTFPCPPSQFSKTRGRSSHIQPADQRDSFSILGHTDPTHTSASCGVFPRTNEAQKNLLIAKPVAAYAKSHISRSAFLSPSNAVRNEETHPPNMSRARVVSNSSSWQHRSMQVEISVLSLDFYAPNLNNTPPGTAVSSKFRISRQPYIP